MGIREKLERIMMAIAFAEAGESETARELLKEGKRPRLGKRIDKRTKPRPQMRSPSMN
jgi:hypothetical protein